MGKAIDPKQVLQEYPRPHMVRKSYENLNGYWEYAFTKVAGYKGDKRDCIQYEGHILVPFSPECVLSGVGRQLMPGEYLFYRKTIGVTDEIQSKRLLLHFGAVDQACKIWVNGICLMRHNGGYLPFYADITDVVQSGENYGKTPCKGKRRGSKKLWKSVKFGRPRLEVPDGFHNMLQMWKGGKISKREASRQLDRLLIPPEF